MELLITLGHNSSAILVKNGKVIVGYEEERLNRIKASSVFPIKSIEKCLSFSVPNKNEKNKIYVSHWFDDFNFQENNHEKIHLKYWNKDFIEYLKKEYNFEVVSLSKEFTHHDAHAYAVKGFYEYHKGPKEDALIMVADGFGNQQEVLSLYKMGYNKGKSKIKLIHRAYGYEYSLGLFYQYSTSFCGMKENQDEYKFLGYESHIHEVINEKNYIKLQEFAKKLSKELIYGLENSTTTLNTNDKEYINLDKLEKVKKKYWGILQNVIDNIDFNNDIEKFNLRVIVGNFIQTTLELVTTYFSNKYSTKNLLVNGGIFYNVKLNNRLEQINNVFCVCPLAGDQGAAIGLYVKNNIKFNFSNLFWGRREINKEINEINIKKLPKNIEIYNNKEEMANRISELLYENEIPQIVLGNMEFGPRALCHSTTLAVPYRENIELINSYNKRNTVMPMAPVILRENLDFFFKKEQFSKTVGSDGFMILTYDYKIPYYYIYSGVMHKYPNEDTYSGRPQVVEDDGSTISLVLKKMKKNVKALVNTSYNTHGKPIVFTVQDAIDDFSFQCKRCEELNIKKPYLIIGNYEE